MTINNETIAEIVREMFEYPKSWGEYNHLDWKALADRIEAAHEREITAKDDERLTIVAIYENVITASRFPAPLPRPSDSFHFSLPTKGKQNE